MCECVCSTDLVGEVELVGVVHQSTPEPEAQLTFQEPDGAVDEGGGDGDQEPFGELQEEGLRVLLDDALHNHACKIKSHERSHDLCGEHCSGRETAHQPSRAATYMDRKVLDIRVTE